MPPPTVCLPALLGTAVPLAAGGRRGASPQALLIILLKAISWLRQNKQLHGPLCLRGFMEWNMFATEFNFT